MNPAITMTTIITTRPTLTPAAIATTGLGPEEGGTEVELVIPAVDVITSFLVEITAFDVIVDDWVSFGVCVVPAVEIFAVVWSFEVSVDSVVCSFAFVVVTVTVCGLDSSVVIVPSAGSVDAVCNLDGIVVILDSVLLLESVMFVFGAYVGASGVSEVGLLLILVSVTLSLVSLETDVWPVPVVTEEGIEVIPILLLLVPSLNPVKASVGGLSVEGTESELLRVSASCDVLGVEAS